MVKKEQIIMWGSVLLVIIVLGLAFSGGENNYLNPSGNRNPANQKLMIVDQDTGEISFIQKSLQGVNAQIATDDSVILKKLEDLEKWNGHRSSEIQTLQNHMKTILGDNLAAPSGYSKSGNTGALDKLLTKINNERTHKYDAISSLEGSINGKIGNGEIIYLQSRAAKGGILQNQCGWPGGDNCNARWGTGNDGQVPTRSDDPKATGHYIRRV